jgi:hypothetical protein
MAAPWRNDPLLVGRFHPKHPDDLEVVVHEGGPRLCAIPPELMWVRLHDVALMGPERRAYRGVLLNSPHRLPNVQSGEEILVLPAKGSPHPIRTSALYLEERAQYDVWPCKKCGFSELFDAPSALIAKIFPNLQEGSLMARFTTYCPLCGGVQEVVASASAQEAESDMDRTKPPQRWLESWKPTSSS